LQPLLREHAPAIEAGRRLTPEVHAALVDAGFYRMTMPAEAGAPDVTLPECLRVLEALAEADASTAWSVWSGLGVPAMSAFLPESGARALFASRDPCVVGSIAVIQRAVAVQGGYKVRGRWPFVSGIHQATHAGGMCFVFDGELQRMAPNGEPVVIFPVWPVASCRIIDTWDTTGLRGTGSDDIQVEDLFVPDDQVVDFARAPRPGLSPVHYMNIDNAANVTVAAMAIGIAHAALGAFRELAPRKKLPNGEILAESALGKIVLANTQSTLAQARGHLYETVETMSEQMTDSTYEDEEWLPRTSLTTVATVDAAIDVVTQVYREAATSSIFRKSVLDRCLRDLFTLGAHKTVQHVNLTIYGARLADAA
jgi:alkylation response protein AidB-like acyl-CoA dehydrogenase